MEKLPQHRMHCCSISSCNMVTSRVSQKWHLQKVGDGRLMSTMSKFMHGAQYLWLLKPVVNYSSVNVRAKLEVVADFNAKRLEVNRAL